MQHLPQFIVTGQPNIGQCLIEAGDRAAVHFFMLPIPTMHSDNGGLITMGACVCSWSTKRLGKVCREPFCVLKVEAVTEGMCYHRVLKNPAMPGLGETPHAVHTTCRFEDSLHWFMFARSMCRCKAI